MEVVGYVEWARLGGCPMLLVHLYAGMEIEEVPDAKDLAFLSSGVAKLGHTGAHALATRGCALPGMHPNYQR